MDRECRRGLLDLMGRLGCAEFISRGDPVQSAPARPKARIANVLSAVAYSKAPWGVAAYVAWRFEALPRNDSRRRLPPALINKTCYSLAKSWRTVTSFQPHLFFDDIRPAQRNA